LIHAKAQRREDVGDECHCRRNPVIQERYPTLRVVEMRRDLTVFGLGLFRHGLAPLRLGVRILYREFGVSDNGFDSRKGTKGQKLRGNCICQRNAWLA
jgi:hypothetical protein